MQASSTRGGRKLTKLAVQNCLQAEISNFWVRQTLVPRLEPFTGIPACGLHQYTMSSIGTDDSAEPPSQWTAVNHLPTFPAFSVKTRTPFPRRQVFLIVTVLLTITLCVLSWTAKIVPTPRGAKPWQLKTNKPCERSILGKDLVADEYGMYPVVLLVSVSALLARVGHHRSEQLELLVFFLNCTACALFWLQTGF